jgi:seryl-tRNA synthetase
VSAFRCGRECEETVMTTQSEELGPLRTTVPGVELTSQADSRLLDGVRAGIAARFGVDRVEHYLAPPVIARATVDSSGYPQLFPHLLGTVQTALDRAEPGAMDLVLTPAACHHMYPLFAARTVVDDRCLSVEATCFRGEATSELGRLRSFRMYEIVRVGTPDSVSVWRDAALDSAVDWLRQLGLRVNVDVASDPFFGRPGRLMAEIQRAEELKREMIAELSDGVSQSIASVNYHREHFGEAFEISLPDGAVAHSACLAFGLDRILIALRHAHGDLLDEWPSPVRSALRL